jgi:UDP-N-acetylmuramoyl-tripeptide--D-alanyl-D-alanine ligase
MRILLDIPLSFSEITGNIKSSTRLASEDMIHAVTTDSREVFPGDLFIALQGENFCGEDFVLEARERGAYVISANKDLADILVADTAFALLEIAAFYKSKLSNLKYTLAITGSVGKTTTKNILTNLLSSDYKVCSTKENYNNIIGVSYTILSAKQDVEILILELGMNHMGEISVLSKAVKPNAAIITNVGTAHIGNLGSRAMIAKAKLEVLDGMKKEMLVVPYEESLLCNANNSFYTFSTENQKASLYAKILESDSEKSVINLHSDKIKKENLVIPKPGRHIISAVMASVGIIELLNISVSSIPAGILKISEKDVRGRYVELGDFRIYEDCYSASYEACIADFELLSMNRNTLYSCVIGDMLELGSETENLHRKIGEMAYKFGFRRIFAFGAYSSFVLSGARSAGMKKEDLFINTDTTHPEITANQILENVSVGETVLIKASNKIRADRITNILKSSRRNNA